MPFLRIETNAALSPDACDKLLKGATDIIAGQMSKPVEYIQVIVDGKSAMSFGGSTDPNALVELRSLGIPEEKPKPLSAAICQLLEEVLSIPPKKVFINFVDMERAMWGWNGSTFG